MKIIIAKNRSPSDLAHQDGQFLTVVVKVVAVELIKIILERFSCRYHDNHSFKTWQSHAYLIHQASRIGQLFNNIDQKNGIRHFFYFSREIDHSDSGKNGILETEIDVHVRRIHSEYRQAFLFDVGGDYSGAGSDVTCTFRFKPRKNASI